MHNKLKKFGSLIIGACALGGVLGAIFGYATVKHDSTIIFGNFGDYESIKLQNRMTAWFKKNENVNLKYTYYNLNNQLPAMYANNQITIGVPTDYEAADLASQGLIKPFSYYHLQQVLTQYNQAHPNQTPWTLGYYLNGKFIKIYNAILPIQVNLKCGQQFQNNYVQYTYNSVGNTSKNLQQQEETEYKYSICNLMAPNVICDITQLYLHWTTPNGDKHINVFQYDLPYFFQNYTFDFTTNGANATQLKELDPLKQPNIPWSQALKIIQNCSWFHSQNNRPEVAMVTSPQSVYSVAAAVQFADGDQVPITNPTSNISSIKSMENTFSYFTNPLSSKYLGSNPIYQSASSTGVINQMDSGQAHGGFCYNGDALYTSMGGNFNSSADWNNLTPNHFFVVHPQYTMIALDTVGMNIHIPNCLVNKAYLFMYRLCLQGCDTSPFSTTNYPYEQNITGPQGNNINFANSYAYITSKYSYSNKLEGLIKGDAKNQSVACPYYSWSMAGQALSGQANSTLNDPWEPLTKQNQYSDFIGADLNLNSNVGAGIANGNYYYGIMQNFYFNLYVSPWLNITNFINENYTGNNSNLNTYSNWFSTESSYNFNAPSANAAAKSYWNAYNNWFENIYTINPSNYAYNIPTLDASNSFNTIPNTCVELPLTNQQISNQQIAFNDAMYDDFGN